MCAAARSSTFSANAISECRTPDARTGLGDRRLSHSVRPTGWHGARATLPTLYAGRDPRVASGARRSLVTHFGAALAAARRPGKSNRSPEPYWSQTEGTLGRCGSRPASLDRLRGNAAGILHPDLLWARYRRSGERHAQR